MFASENAEADYKLREAAKTRMQEEADERRAEEARLDLIPILPEEKEVATLIHDMFCRWNHTDGCAWYYSKGTDHDWNHTSERKGYMKRARNILSTGASAENVIKTLELVRDSK